MEIPNKEMVLLMYCLKKAKRKKQKQQHQVTVEESKEKEAKTASVTDEYSTKQGNGVLDVETLRGMGVRELRYQASKRGLSFCGTKKEIFDRLSACVAVLDQYLPDNVKANYHVLEYGGEIYDAMLSRTNVTDNSNKFYVIQALEFDSGGAFMVFTRGGRVGVKGQNKLQTFSSRDEAIKEFVRKFYAKTHNHWYSRKNFVYQPNLSVWSSRKNCYCQRKLYTWLEMDYSQESQVPKKLKDSSIQPRETQLDSRVAKFISLICDVRMMKQQMVEIGYNAEKLPLGKLSKSTISKGFNVLKSISEAMTANPDRKTLEELTGAFYTVIPHDFGFKKKIREFIIDTPQKLKSKIEMVEALSEIELATKLLEDGDDVQEDIPYTHYNRLQCELRAMDVGSNEYSVVEKYMQNTQSGYNVGYNFDIVQLFRVSRKCEDERFRKFSNTKNRMLLWHGSPLTNWTGILSQGLREPKTFGFGRGVYFADMFSTSIAYCRLSSLPGVPATGVLLLCEVALGEIAELPTPGTAAQLPPGKLSIKAVGAIAPDPAEFQALDDGVIVPLGKPKHQRGSMGSNEYIVFNVDQIRMRYLVHVKYNYGNRI
ncbi:hypothetical protein MKW94_012552 [Papaver nudicaule]|uniref:Poly [ADP-ribose] polymerase n=1 Tax=Papaver nudicaule TaxID=74823 RepID=A0AA41V0U5_PAPNU|nr:hypothetical protein [Papaver nudicaule]